MIPRPKRVDEKVIPRNVADYCFESLPKDGESVPDFPRVKCHTLLKNIPMRAKTAAKG
jgi:hypothetical protein